jgi:HEAT repeat protein
MYSPSRQFFVAEIFLSGFIAVLFANLLPAQAPAPTPAHAPATQAPPPAAQTAPAQTPQTPETKPATAKVEKPQPPKEKAWAILNDGLKEDNAERRAKTVNALGLLTGDPAAEKLAIAALKDEKANVRVAAATALGAIHARGAKEPLESMLDDSEPAVVLAAANSLLILNDDVGYDVYFAVLTGDKKTSRGLIKEQMKILHDPKKMAELGITEGVGFIPFGGLGYGVVKMVLKSEDSGAVVKASAARRLAHDPDPSSGEALVAATTDKSWIVRAGALQAISERGDKSLSARIVPALDDEKEDVRYIAAAGVIHLDSVRTEKTAVKRTKKS